MSHVPGSSPPPNLPPPVRPAGVPRSVRFLGSHDVVVSDDESTRTTVARMTAPGRRRAHLPCPPLILTNARDPTANLEEVVLRSRGVEILRLNTEEYGASFQIDVRVESGATFTMLQGPWGRCPTRSRRGDLEPASRVAATADDAPRHRGRALRRGGVQGGPPPCLGRCSLPLGEPSGSGPAGRTQGLSTSGRCRAGLQRSRDARIQWPGMANEFTALGAGAQGSQAG